MPDRKSHWEKVYNDKSPQEASWYQKKPTLSLQLIGNTQISHSAPIIDIGGGASTLVDSLCEQGYSHIGVLDISSKALTHSKNRLADKACGVEWYNLDVVDFNPPQQFSVWHDRAVFHFLTNQVDRNKYVDVLKRVLETGGHLIIMAFAIDGPRKCSGLDIVQYDANKLLEELGEGFDLVESGHEIHMTPTGGEQKFAYFRFRKVV